MKYNLEHIQKHYDEGLSWIEVASNLKISEGSLRYMRKKGFLKSRDAKTKMKFAAKKISSAMKVAHDEGRHPGWLSVNLNKENRTYPEQFFINAIGNFRYLDNYTILEKVAFHQYVFDFVIVEEKIDIEIDGEHHLHDFNTVEKDVKRDKKAIANGWKVFRISWDELRLNTSKVMDELINFIKLNKSDNESVIQVITLEPTDNPRSFRAAKFKISCHPPKPKRQVGEYRPKFKLRKVVRPPKEELEKLVWQIPSLHLSSKFGVSDRTIGKWCKWYDITKPPRGYWMKNA
jgi:very-short-patch-repair endonuclease